MNDRLFSPKVTKDILDTYRFKFTKSLGQNFLIDGNILDKICEGADITKEDDVLEIGPGIGTLTQILCEKASTVVAVEIDKNLIPILSETMNEYDNLQIINDDILKMDLHTLIKDKFNNKKIKVAANLPYYITTPIVMKLLEKRLNIDKIVVMVQKEVANRMQSAPGSKDYGALSVGVQYYAKPEIVTHVSRNVFIPKPKVDSAVIMLDIYDKPPINVNDEKTFFNVVKSAFGKRRKNIANSLSSGYIDVSKKEIKEILEKLDIDKRLRAENLSLEDFANITNAILQK